MTAIVREICKVKLSETGDSVLKVQRGHAGHQFGSERKVMRNFVLITSGCDEEKEKWVQKVLLLFYCVVQEN